MTWSREVGYEGDESAKIRWELVPYTAGRGLELGSGPAKAFPHFIGLDANQDYIKVSHALRPELCSDCCDLQMFASDSMDFVFSSHLLERVEDYQAALKEWWRVIKPGGHLCLYLPHKDLYPNIGQNGSNPEHKHDFAPADIERAMLKIGSWDQLEDQKRDQGEEYSFFQVYKKLTGTKHHYSHRLPKPRKTCAVVRYGAFGDAIQTASIFPGLKAQGFHITLYCGPVAHQVLKEDPHVDRFIVQDTNQVPNVWLDDFWADCAKKYDRFVNLSESIEGTLLAMPGRVNHRWPYEVRHRYMNRNYLEWTHELAGVPYDGKGVTFYATDIERAWAKQERKKMGPFVVLWSLAGSAVHKAWPFMDSIIARLMLHTDAHVVLVGGDDGVLLERGWEQEARVHRTSGKWSIRQSMVFCEVADLIIGTETGLLNAAAFLPVPKVITLSHSSVENLTRDWINTTSLVPSTKDVPCFSCHMMHYSFQYCHRDLDPNCEKCKTVTCDEHTGAALCQSKITAAQMWEAVERVLNERERKSA
jgi:ADP-heptose:LPS heptosyltransferase/predicted SAM-dependent methyltransferase